MTDQLAIQIVKDFQRQFSEFLSNKTGLIKQYFDNHNVTGVKKFKYKDYTGFGVKKGSNISGKVVINFNNGHSFIGDYVNNKKNGEGYHGFDNCYYKGQYKNDIKVGGIVCAKENDKEVYVGGWGQDTYHGKGVLTRLNGQCYDGNFNYGQLHGDGKLTFLNGDVYEGDFDQNVRRGKGTYTKSNGDIYEGDFDNNLFNGQGKYTWLSGEVFFGNFIDGQMGEGEMDYKFGVKGSGIFKESRRDITYKLDTIQLQLLFIMYLNQLFINNVKYKSQQENILKSI